MFITFEGGEGSGKTTLMKKLKAALEEKGYKIVATRGPGGTPLGNKIRDLLLNPDHEFEISPRAELMLYLADRVQMIDEIIQPALDKGEIVLVDRYNDSSIAYQGGARGLGVKEVQDLCDHVCQGLVPDLTFFLDIDPLIAFSRLTEKPDRLEQEKMEFHQKVREAFALIAAAEPKRFHIIDATMVPDEVFAEAFRVIESKLHE